MKAEFLLTIRLTPESRGEMIDTFGAQYRKFRDLVEGQKATGAAIEIPPTTQIRWLLDSGRWE